MQIEPAMCPACGAAYDPLRAQAVTVIDGRVRAFCSVECRQRGKMPQAPSAPAADAQAAIVAPPPPSRTVRTEHVVLVAAGVVTMIGFVALLMSGRHKAAVQAATVPRAETAAQETKRAIVDEASENDAWLQPLAGVTRHVGTRDRRLFNGREGIPASECAGGRCGIDIEGAAGSVVMAVHDGVIEAVGRAPDTAEGRFIRIIHRGGALTTSYLGLDGIREDLRPGIPVKMGEPIGTVARAQAGARPHFRFTISARNDDGAVLFIDPQPLMALWPIRRQASRSLRAMERAPRAEDDESQ